MTRIGKSGPRCNEQAKGKLSCTLVHVDLTVADMERSLAFYTDSLGLLVLEDCTVETEAARFLSAGKASKMRMVFLTSGTTTSFMVELIQLLDEKDQEASGERRDVIFAFLVDDLPQAIRSLAVDGRQPVTDVFPIELPQLGRAQVVFFRDPDGYLIEFVEFVKTG
jgi:catechol 2,3-dioxygenase-like lactoylglutathione lyase family enzyme